MSVITIELNPQDLELLHTAAIARPATRERSGVTSPTAVAQIALGALCRRILAQGYQPKPLAVLESQDGQEGVTFQIRAKGAV